MLCDSSNLHKQKLVKPKPLASKMAAVKKVGQKNGEVGLLVEYLFCDMVMLDMVFVRDHVYFICILCFLIFPYVSRYGTEKICKLSPFLKSLKNLFGNIPVCARGNGECCKIISI